MRRWIDHQKIRIEQTPDSVFFSLFQYGTVASKNFPPFGRNFSPQNENHRLCVVCLCLCARSAKKIRLFVVLHDFRCPQSHFRWIFRKYFQITPYHISNFSNPTVPYFSPLDQIWYGAVPYMVLKKHCPVLRSTDWNGREIMDSQTHVSKKFIS